MDLKKAIGLASTSLLVASIASAEVISQNVSGIAHAVVPAQEVDIQKAPSGVSNTAAAARDVLFTPPRTALDEGLNQQHVTMTATKAAGPLVCQAAAYRQSGALIDTENFMFPNGPGTFTRTTTFNSADPNFFDTASIVVRCTLRGANADTVHAVRVTP